MTETLLVQPVSTIFPYFKQIEVKNQIQIFKHEI